MLFEDVNTSSRDNYKYQVVNLIWYLFRSLKKELPSIVPKSTKDICMMCYLEECTQLLATTITDMSEEQKNKIMYPGGSDNKEARNLAVWFDSYGKWTLEKMKYREDKNNRLRRKSEILSKLSPYDRECVQTREN